MDRSSSLSSLRLAIEEVARRDPDRVAFGDGDAGRSYADLARLFEGEREARAGERGTHVAGDPIADVEAILAEGCAGAGACCCWTRRRPPGRSSGPRRSSSRRASDGRAGARSASAPPAAAACRRWSSSTGRACCSTPAPSPAAAGYGEGDVVWCTTPLAHLYCFGAGVLGGTAQRRHGAAEQGCSRPGRVRPASPWPAGAALLLSVPFLFRRYLEIAASGRGARGGLERPELHRRRRAGPGRAGRGVARAVRAAGCGPTTGSPRAARSRSPRAPPARASGHRWRGRGADRRGRRDRGAAPSRGAATGSSVRSRTPGGWYETGDLGHLDAGRQPARHRPRRQPHQRRRQEGRPGRGRGGAGRHRGDRGLRRGRRRGRRRRAGGRPSCVAGGSMLGDGELRAPAGRASSPRTSCRGASSGSRRSRAR